MDPTTGNVWVVIPEVPIEKSRVIVVSPLGQRVAEHAIQGFDIAHSRFDDCFWIVGKDVTKVDKKGNVVGQIAGQIPSWASSVSIDQKTGNAWVVVRDHPDVPESKLEVWTVDKRVQVKSRIDLGDLMPFCVAVDSESAVPAGPSGHNAPVHYKRRETAFCAFRVRLLCCGRGLTISRSCRQQVGIGYRNGGRNAKSAIWNGR